MMEYQKDNLEVVCGVEYEHAIHECAVEGGYASVWAVCALATVIKRPIVSVYPRFEYGENILATVLNRKLMPRRNHSDTIDPIFIMWTRASPQCPGAMWTSNHFVPLVRTNHTSTLLPQFSFSRPWVDETSEITADSVQDVCSQPLSELLPIPMPRSVSSASGRPTNISGSIFNQQSVISSARTHSAPIPAPRKGLPTSRLECLSSTTAVSVPDSAPTFTTSAPISSPGLSFQVPVPHLYQ